MVGRGHPSTVRPHYKILLVFSFTLPIHFQHFVCYFERSFVLLLLFGVMWDRFQNETQFSYRRKPAKRREEVRLPAGK